MPDITDLNLDYERPIKLASDVYWVGIQDLNSGCYSNPYIILENDEAVLIDGGSRTDFPSVMMKIMEIGITPSSISALIYQNYTPRLCGSLPHLEVIIGRKDLQIITDHANHMFMQHYSESANLVRLEDLDFQFVFASGRPLRFIKTPFAHSAGSFVTFDEKNDILFTGDLFSSYSSRLSLFARLRSNCKNCEGHANGGERVKFCPIYEILRFHQDIMASERALKSALDQIASVPFTTIAPQHGAIIYDPDDIVLICDLLASLRGVGIDGVIGDRSFFNLGDTGPIRKRLRPAPTNGT
jgi:flavorubredoxin